MVEVVKSVFEKVLECRNWELCLLRVSVDRGSTHYSACHISLDPPGKLCEFANELVKHYCQGRRPRLDKYSSCVDYDGSSSSDTIYRLTTESELISQSYLSLISALGNPIHEAKPVDFDASAYVLVGTIQDEEGSPKSVKIFSMQAPLTKLKHRFFHDSNTFKEIDNKVLYLREAIDVLIFDTVIYFFDMRGENLFSMDRAYRTTCNRIVEDIRGMDICSDIDLFTSVATSGVNPRRFVSFDRNRLTALSNPETRPEKASMFDLEVGPDGKIDTGNKVNAEKLVKVLCKKGMYDPFDEVPVEVPASRKW